MIIQYTARKYDAHQYFDPGVITYVSDPTATINSIWSDVSTNASSWASVATISSTWTCIVNNSGKSWTDQTSGVSTHLRSIYYDPDSDLWIACGDSGVILTATGQSPGSWTSRTSGVTTSLRTVRKFLGSYYIVGHGDGTNPATVLKSVNGTTWSAEDIGGGASSLVTIGIIDDTKMLFGGWNLPFATKSALIVSTTDGVNYTRTSYTGFYGVYGITNNGSTWGIVGTNAADDTVGYYATSTDGTTLVDRTSSLNPNYSTWVIDYDGTHWVAGTGTGQIKYSVDGIGWTTASAPDIADEVPNFNIWRITHNQSGDMLLSGGWTQGRILRSVNSGKTWTQVYTNDTGALMSKAWFGPCYWVAVGWTGQITKSTPESIWSDA